MTGLVLMTALPPTEGHLSLCRFAAAHARTLGQSVLVMVCVLPDEPPGRGEHRDALAVALKDEWNVRVEVQFSNDPQGPKSDNDDEFWAHWVRVILNQTQQKVSHVYSSEAYGLRLADSLGAVHIPFSPGRSVTGAKATHVRNALVSNFGQIIKPLRDRLRRRVVLFGQESTGKTTMAKALAGETNSLYAPEWARPYLEGLPTPETTAERMSEIARGQHAFEQTAWKLAEDRGCPFVFYDTDLLSTIGYDRHFAAKDVRNHTDDHRKRADALEEWFVPADLYIVCAPTIPLERDPLRYGGDERETSKKFWIDILEERELNYVVVDSPESGDRFRWALSHSLKLLRDRAGFCDYVRS